MTASNATIPTPIAETLIQIKSSTVIPDEDVTGSGGAAGADELIYVVQIDNSINSATSYSKIYNAQGVSAGNDVPDVILPCPGGSVIEYVMLEGIPMAEGGGGSPDRGIAILTVVEPGTSGDTSPTSAVEVRMLINT